MGRPGTGAWTVYESLRIELSYLLKNGWIKKGYLTYFNLNWSDQRGNPTGAIACHISYLDKREHQFLQVSYRLTARNNGKETDHRYKIYFCEKDSNLGKGKVLYFLCPVSGRRCRILYRAYGSDVFKSRESYQHRLYYDCQQTSKLNQYNDSYWRIEKHLKNIKKKAGYGKRTYKGSVTKAAQRYNRLSFKQCKMDELRWTAGVPKSLRKQIFG